MYKTSLIVDNLKCGGCEKTVEKILSGIDGISEVHVDADQGTIDLGLDDKSDLVVEKAVALLTKAGYPPAGESTLRDKAISYISCMKGRLAD